MISLRRRVRRDEEHLPTIRVLNLSNASQVLLPNSIFFIQSPDVEHNSARSSSSRSPADDLVFLPEPHTFTFVHIHVKTSASLRDRHRSFIRLRSNKRQASDERAELGSRFGGRKKNKVELTRGCLPTLLSCDI